MEDKPIEQPATEPRAEGAVDRLRRELASCRECYQVRLDLYDELRRAIRSDYDETHHEACERGRRLAGVAGEQSGARNKSRGK